MRKPKWFGRNPYTYCAICEDQVLLRETKQRFVDGVLDRVCYSCASKLDTRLQGGG